MQYRARVDTIYPEMLGEPEEKNSRTSFEVSQSERVVRSKRDGHIQSLDPDAILKLCESEGLVCVLEAEPGDFVLENQVLATIHGDGDFETKNFQAAFVIGKERSPTQDLLYLSDQLIDIAGRALSPGINDPQTAIGCINWLSAGLNSLAQRQFPSRLRLTEEGKPFLLTSGRDFEYYVDSIYDQLRPYVERDPNAGLHMVRRSITTLRTIPQKNRRCLYVATQRLVEGCLRHFDHSRDLEKLQELRDQLCEINTSDVQLRSAARPA